MDITIHPKKLTGIADAIPSKSYAHRLLICSAFSKTPTKIVCPETNEDISATADCLRALGATVTRTADGYSVQPCDKIPNEAVLPCAESGSTLRFLLPIAGALGVSATFSMAGRLSARPLSPLWEEMERMGCTLTRPAKDNIRCTGKLKPGLYTISGNISSQFITGLLFAAALMPGKSTINITGKLESKPYVDITKDVLTAFGVKTENNVIYGSYPFQSPGDVCVEGDWSNAAFFLAAGAIGNNVTVSGLNSSSCQGDRKIAQIIPQLKSGFQRINTADIPDLVPIMAVAAGALHGAVFEKIQRLRIKESDRVATVAKMLEDLGAEVTVTEETLTVKPAKYRSCTIDASNDHRIAMAAAIAASVACGPLTILGAQCVNKSYPTFWEQYRRLGGNYEQHLR